MIRQEQAEQIIALGFERARILKTDGGVWWKTRVPDPDGPAVAGSEDWTDEQLREALGLYGAIVAIYGGIAAIDAFRGSK